MEQDRAAPGWLQATGLQGGRNEGGCIGASAQRTTIASFGKYIDHRLLRGDLHRTLDYARGIDAASASLIRIKQYC